jgi:hypothetical protein
VRQVKLAFAPARRASRFDEPTVACEAVHRREEGLFFHPASPSNSPPANVVTAADLGERLLRSVRVPLLGLVIAGYGSARIKGETIKFAKD